MNFNYRRSYRGPLQAVLLDWAGTTLDYGSYAPAVAFIEVYKRHGVDITIEEAREPMGAHKKVHIRKISQIPAVAKKWEVANGTPCTEKDLEAMFAEFIPLQLACLGEYADLIPGTIEAVKKFRDRGLKIGSTTGYTGEMMGLLLEEAKKRGYEPDSTVCATDVPAGRPEPWMCLENAKKLGVYPMEAIVKIGDTLPDIYEGLNAKEIEDLPPEQLQLRLERARNRMAQAGAHYIVDGILDCDPILDEINARLARDEQP